MHVGGNPWRIGGFEIDLTRRFGIDSRSLGLFRIGLAFVVLWDLCARATDLTAHYTDRGVLPLAHLSKYYQDTHLLSFHTISGSWEWQAFLFGLCACSSLCLLIGFKTKVATAFTWALTISLHLRNPTVLDSGDTLLVLLLFWGMLLPLGRRFSVDRRKPKPRPAAGGGGGEPVFSFATAGLLLQVAFMYVFTVLWKLDSTWISDGTAVHLALQLDRFATPLGVWLRETPEPVLELLTFSTIGWEALGPILALFFPWAFGPVRTGTVFGFVLLHVGIGASLALGIFPLVSIVGWIPFLPKWFWETARKTLPGRVAAPSGKKSEGPLRLGFGPRPVRQNAFVNAVACLAIFYVLAYNIYDLDSSYTEPFNEAFEPLAPYGRVAHLSQSWGMFAPYPSLVDGWFIAQGTLKNRQKVNLFSKETPLSGEKPPQVARTYKNTRWRNYLGGSILQGGAEHLQLPFSTFLWRRWNRNHRPEQHLSKLTLLIAWEDTKMNGEVKPVKVRRANQIKSPTDSSGADLEVYEY